MIYSNGVSSNRVIRKGSAIAEGFGIEIGGGRAAGRIGNEHDALPRQFESLAAAQVAAGDELVHADHVGAGLRETFLIFLAGSAREFFLFGADHPAHGIGAFLVAVRADQGEILGFRPLAVELALVHAISVVAY